MDGFYLEVVLRFDDLLLLSGVKSPPGRVTLAGGATAAVEIDNSLDLMRF